MNRNLKRVIIPISLLCLLFICMISGVTKADNSTMSFDIYPRNSNANNNPAILTLNGKKYVDNLWFDNISSNSTSVSDEEKFIVKVVNTNQQGTQDDVLNLWLPDDRTDMSTIISDADIFSLNQSKYKDIKYSVFLGRLDYGDYTVFVVQHILSDNTNLVKLYPIKYLDGSYYLTNELSDDPVFNQLMQIAKDSFSLKTK